MAGISRLDQLKIAMKYLPIFHRNNASGGTVVGASTTERKTNCSGPKALAADVILAAQPISVANEGHEVIIATTNVGHWSQFVDVRE